MLYHDYIVIMGLSYHLLLAPIAWWLSSLSPSKKTYIIIFQLSLYQGPQKAERCHQLSQNPQEWCGSQREMGGFLEFHDQIRPQNVSAPHHDARPSALARGRRRTEAWDDGRAGAQEAENVQNDAGGRSCKCETTVMSGRIVVGSFLWISVKGVMEIHWTRPMISGKNFEWHKIVCFFRERTFHMNNRYCIVITCCFIASLVQRHPKPLHFSIHQSFGCTLQFAMFEQYIDITLYLLNLRTYKISIVGIIWIDRIACFFPCLLCMMRYVAMWLPWLPQVAGWAKNDVLKVGEPVFLAIFMIYDV